MRSSNGRLHDRPRCPPATVPRRTAVPRLRGLSQVNGAVRDGSGAEIALAHQGHLMCDQPLRENLRPDRGRCLVAGTARDPDGARLAHLGIGFALTNFTQCFLAVDSDLLQRVTKAPADGADSQTPRTCESTHAATLAEAA